MEQHKKLATVTVTYNRKELLLENIRAVIAQNYNIDCIIIVDNHSTDNTKEAVMSEFPNNKIKYLYLEENTGGAGGFYTGCKYAYDNGYDWVLLMDDDGKPKNNETIGNLMKQIDQKGFNKNDKVMLNSVVLCDDNNITFKLFSHVDTLESIKKKAKDGIVQDKTSPFNGTLISNGLMKEIGFPNKELFVSIDERDYNKRTKEANAYMGTVIDSLYYHPAKHKENSKKINFFGKTYYLFQISPWKMYYNIRNMTYVFGKNKKNLYKFLFQRFMSICLMKCKKIECIKMMIKGYKDGKNGVLGKTIEPY